MSIYESLGQSSDPAANTELSLTLAQKSLLHSLSFTFVADVNVANRFIYLVFTDGSDVELFRIPVYVLITASHTVCIVFGLGLDEGGVEATLIGSQYIPLPTNLVLEAGYKIKTVTTDLQATDDYGVMSVFGKKL